MKDYLLGEVLYRGSATRVVAAVERSTGTEVAIKLAGDEPPSARTLDMLRHEHAVLAELAVPGIIRAHRLAPHGPGLALVLERWGAGSLDQALARAPLPVETVLRLGAALARAIGQVHRKKIVHRDIKPQNVLVDTDLRQVRLIDFGIATRSRARVEADAPIEALAGTLAYMAPEQTGRMQRAVDARADLYGLGTTLYQMLTGALPFELSDPVELIHAHIARMPVPPPERSPARAIPEAVSAIVLKLLEKSPEQRYQTAEGAAWDLEQALQAWATTHAVVPFALGARDWENRIRKASRLFGRENELASLMTGLRRACGGEAVFALVAGPSGVGKSALVHALRAEVRAQNAVFAAGKLDQLRRAAAHEALRQALRSVVRLRLASSVDELDRWTAIWQQAAGANARILIDFVPELRHVLGDPPPLPDVGPAEAKTRFEATIRHLVRATASADHPLVLFLDDLQWADATSLSLLEELVTAPDVAHLYVLGAYRDQDVDKTHPLHALAARAAEHGRALQPITLAPLDDRAVEAMVQDMLGSPAQELGGLSALVKAKTDGSPFFVEQFLSALHDRGLLARDVETGAWCWQAEQIEREGVTDNVAVLLLAKISALPAPCRHLLALGACLGPSFDAELAGAAAGTASVRNALDELHREGLVVPAAGEDAQATWMFVHDRVQQAAYESCGQDERSQAHLALARAMRRRGAAEPSDDELFAMLHQVVGALALIGGTEEAPEAVAALLRGGQRAKALTAYDLAATWLRAARGLLGEQAWDDVFERMFDTELALAEAEWLAGRPDAASPCFEQCMARAPDRVHEARTAITWAPLLFLAGRYAQGLDMTLGVLKDMGYPFPRDAAGQERFVGELIGRVAPRLASTDMDGWRQLPRCVDPAESLTAELLGTARLLAGALEPPLQLCLVFTLVDHAFAHGISTATASAMSMAAICLIGPLQLVDLGARCVDFVLDLLRTPDIAKAGPMFEIALAAQFVLPLGPLLEHWQAVPDVCVREGSILYEEFALAAYPLVHLFVGRPVDLCVVPVRTWRNAMCGELGAIGARYAVALRGGDPATDPDQAIASVMELQASSPTTIGIRGITAAYVAMHLGEDTEALRLAMEGEPLWMALYCTAPDIELQHILTCLGPVAPHAEGAQADTVAQKVALHRGRLEKLASINPTTFRPLKALGDAAEARAGNHHETAERLYEEAIEQAKQSHFLGTEALGLRLAGEYALSRGLVRAAGAYLRDACDTYIRWGAHAAAAQLRRRHPALCPEGAANDARSRSPVTTLSTSSVTARDGSFNPRFDAAGILRAAQALAGDMAIGSLLERMLRVLAENAGADRAVLALARDGGLRVRAELSLEPPSLATDLDEPVQGSTRLPAALAQYVARSREPVVLGQAGVDPRFDDEPYLDTRRPASALAVPLLHQGRLAGVIYLEHARAPGAFPEARIETVALLAAQAATAVENATLYAELHAHSERLEQQVRERTAQLEEAKQAADAANQAKSDFLASMSHELRTPLNSILGYAQILDRSTTLSAQEREHVIVIRNSGEHLLGLINDVLDLARIEAGKLELSPRPVDLQRLLRIVAGMCEVRAGEKGITFTHELKGPSPLTVSVDEKRLTQVLLNLTGNAVKFTDRGGVRLAVDVEADGHARTARFRVEDTGPGIAPEHLSRIFDPFEQAGDEQARAEGTGLGLSITRRIVEHMGGTIDVESELGRGSAFVVTLRLPEATASDTAGRLGWNDIAGYQGPRLTVLVVDDIADNRAVLCGMLSPIGFDVLQAQGGAEALSVAAAHRPACVLMDVVMPDMDGYETTRRLRALPGLERLVVIALSASASEAERAGSASAGCDEFLPKPVRADDLIDSLERCLGLAWIRREPSAGEPVPLDPASILPPAEVLSALLELVNRGRIRHLVQEIQRIEVADPRLAPWLGQLREAARQFQLAAVRELIEQAQQG